MTSPVSHRTPLLDQGTGDENLHNKGFEFLDPPRRVAQAIQERDRSRTRLFHRTFWIAALLPPGLFLLDQLTSSQPGRDGEFCGILGASSCLAVLIAISTAFFRDVLDWMVFRLRCWSKGEKPRDFTRNDPNASRPSRRQQDEDTQDESDKEQIQP